MKDIPYDFGSDVLVLRSCYHQDGADLLAIAGEGSVQVIQCTSTAIRPLAYFSVGPRVTAIAWSPRSVSPSSSDEWSLELAVSAHDFSLHLLTKSHNAPENIKRFGGGLTGHRARVNDITFVGGQEDNARHVATVSNDNNLIVWDLRPTVPDDEELDEDIYSNPPEVRPTALVIPFAYPLCSVSSHASTSKEFLVSDVRGSVFMINWRKDPNDGEEEAFSHQNILELMHPKAMANAVTNTAIHLFGWASWRPDDTNIVGAVFGSEFALWDISKLQGGKPYVTSSTFPEGGHRFRWCPSFPEYFAVSTSATTPKGAAISVHNMYHLQAQSNPNQFFQPLHRVIDFDWIGSREIPRVAVAVGRVVYIFSINLD